LTVDDLRALVYGPAKTVFIDRRGLGVVHQ
jgi:hypothetical protein